MSYCKWENTANAMHQCLESITDGETDEDIRGIELASKKRVLELAAQLLEETGELDKIIEGE